MDTVRFQDKSQPGVNALADNINTEAALANVPPCALAAIVDVETGGRNILQEGIPPGPDCGVGVCQITAGVDWSNPSHPTYEGIDLWNVADNLHVAAAFFLAPAITAATRLKAQNPSAFAQWGDGQILWYAFAAYNEGVGAVTKALAEGRNPDSGTTDGYATRAMAAYLDFVQASHAAGMT